MRSDTRRTRHGKPLGNHNGMWYAKGFSFAKGRYRRAIRRYWRRVALANVGAEDEVWVPERSVPNWHSTVGWHAT